MVGYRMISPSFEGLYEEGVGMGRRRGVRPLRLLLLPSLIYFLCVIASKIASLTLLCSSITQLFIDFGRFYIATQPLSSPISSTNTERNVIVSYLFGPPILIRILDRSPIITVYGSFDALQCFQWSDVLLYRNDSP